MTTKAYGAHAADKPLQALDIERRAPGPQDVQIEIAYCGVCHSDLHTVRSEWGGTLYPCVPGHEIVGHVSAVGSEVTGFKVGDTVCHLDAPALVAGLLGIVAGMALNFTGCVHFVFRASGMVRAAAHALDPAAVAAEEEPLPAQPAAEWGS